jgi:glycosyltransferase involved in cell wall biosynthesis
MCNLSRRTDADQTVPTILMAFPYLVLGGGERLLSQVVPGLRKSGFRIVIVTTVPSWPHLADTTSWFEPATSEIYHLPRFLPRSRWVEFIDYLIDAKRVNALLIVGSLFFYDIIPELKAKHPAVRVADLLFNAVAHADNNRSIAAQIDVILVEGEKVRSWLLAKGERPERICLIPSGIDLQRFRPAGKPSRIMLELGFPPDAFIVGFSGRLAEEKAPLSFLRIAASIASGSPIRFAMTGAGPLEEKVRATLRRNQLGERLHFAGMVDDVRDYLACYDVLVLPSVFDGRPTVVMEALAMGIPVIASEVGSLPDLVIHGETGFLCKPTDLRAFAGHIQWLCDHPGEYARMRQAARQFAEAHFRLEPMVSSYVQVFEKLAGHDMAQTLPFRSAV